MFPSLVSGTGLTLSFPDWDLYWLAWIALVPMIKAASCMATQKAFQIGFATGMVHFTTLLYWIAPTISTYGQIPMILAVPVLILLCFYLSLYTGIFCAGISRLESASPWMPLQAAALWTGLEYLKSFLLTGFPWGVTGYSQYNNLNLIQIADITGVYGVSFLLVLANTTFACTWLYFRRKNLNLDPFVNKSIKPIIPFLFLGLLTGATLYYGNLRLNQVGQAIEKADHINVAVIQGNIGQSDKWEESFKNETLERYFNLTRAAALQKPEIMIWPETALPFYYPWDKNPTKRVDAFIAKTGISTIFGAPAFEPSGDKFNYFNRAFLMNAKGIITGTYDKVHLVPFGEYVPFGNILSFLGKLVAHAGDFSPGKKDSKPLRFNDTSAGILICFEIVFPSLSRSHVNNGAELLLTITNDAWFGTSSAPLQHFSFGVFRAVETRRALARSANTGISGFIYPSGKILKTTRLFETTFLIESLPKLKIKTLYSRLGDFFPMICLVAMISLFVVKRRVKQASS